MSREEKTKELRRKILKRNYAEDHSPFSFIMDLILDGKSDEEVLAEQHWNEVLAREYIQQIDNTICELFTEDMRRNKNGS